MQPEPQPASAAEAPPPLRSVHTPNLPKLFDQLGISLLVTTYQAGKLVMVRDEGDHLNTHFCGFHAPMGMVTFWNFIAMGAATIGVMYFVDIKDFAGFLTMFLILFVTTGIGNGSTYRMIPAIFREEKRRETKGLGDVARAVALKAASIESAAALGFIGAVGACGGYLIPRGFGASIAATGSPHVALAVFLAFYVTCIALTWWYYLRSTFTSIAPSLAEARV